jgi:uncharacterized protein (DUF488 family)
VKPLEKGREAGCASVRLWTIGHGHQPATDFARLLLEQRIELAVDVRSVPGTRWAPQFNRPELQRLGREQGFRYLWIGRELGGIPEDASLYDEQGYVLYGPLAAQPSFGDALARLESLASEQRTALVCVEEEPERCHRHVLLARVLAEHGAEIRHIRGDGSIETDVDVNRRLGGGQESLFGSGDPRPWRSPQPMLERRRSA